MDLRFASIGLLALSTGALAACGGEDPAPSAAGAAGAGGQGAGGGAGGQAPG
ncbi:MAG: hypothetical protein IT372_30925, partial [Polyangiaceae bacterium]|nr:hypothetical protein [Polyangiaceae bacterium]